MESAVVVILVCSPFIPTLLSVGRPIRCSVAAQRRKQAASSAGESKAQANPLFNNRKALRSIIRLW
ncbi:hypothetical protein EJ02DRAFT_456998 [Clathrospora elynae]|uniref:Uncharacterized protein n=1 Tax=Clathrospora elynae TaxID=706981 RepID=A0A6A5SI86_9PLEO|nr:hypothetical protein EJ02DRAFT_456998 [Clathrospora elynae]